MFIQEGEMPRCEGRPERACPAQVIDNSVKLCQGDLMLCKDCDEYRFPTISVCRFPTNSSATLPDISDKQHMPDGDDITLQRDERNSGTRDKKLVVKELLFFMHRLHVHMPGII